MLKQVHIQPAGRPALSLFDKAAVDRSVHHSSSAAAADALGFADTCLLYISAICTRSPNKPSATLTVLVYGGHWHPSL